MERQQCKMLAADSGGERGVRTLSARACSATGCGVCATAAAVGAIRATMIDMISPATQLYHAAPVPVQNLLVSAYGLRLRHLRYGDEHRRFLDMIRPMQWQSSAQLEAAQLVSLNEVLRHARATVPFYHDRLPGAPLANLGALERIPMLTKADVRVAGRALISTAFAARKLYTVHTGGTTGTPLSIYCDRPTLQRNYSFFSRFQESIALPSHPRVATFAGRAILAPEQSRPPFWRRNYPGNALLCSSYHISAETIPQYVEALARFGPELIDSYPSSIAPIARYVRDQGITGIRPKAVITSSETLSADVRRMIEEAFACRVFDHYGAAEMTAFVTQCSHGAYHCNSDYGIVELVHDGRPAAQGEMGEIVATGFINPVMPLLRYATGDYAVRGPDSCPCGRAFPILARIVGRMDDVLVTPEGRLVGRLDPIFKAVSSLTETRVVQDELDHVRVEWVADRALTMKESSTLLLELRNRLGPSMRIDLVRVPRVPRTASGKFRSVVNLVHPHQQREDGMESRVATQERRSI
jgi:phenylacetate-CoA ligase